MVNKLTIYYKWQLANIRAEMQYKKDFIITMITVTIQPFISLISFYIFTSKFKNLGG